MPEYIPISNSQVASPVHEKPKQGRKKLSTMAFLSFIVVAGIFAVTRSFPVVPPLFSSRHLAPSVHAPVGPAYSPYNGYSAPGNAFHYFSRQSSMHAAAPQAYNRNYNPYYNAPNADAQPYAPAAYYNPSLMHQAAHAAHALRNPVSAPLPHYLFPHHDDTHIFGGGLADNEYVCSLVYVNLGRGYCSGVLVTPTAVMTAAHCFNRVRATSAVSIFIGDRMRGTSPRVPVTGVYILKGWTGSVIRGFDVAVVTLGEAQRPECAIPPQIFAKVQPADGDAVLALGYGTIDARGNDSPDLKQAPLKIAAAGKTLAGNTECVSQVDDTDSGALQQVVCAVSPGYPTDHAAGTCGGDSGGPLVKKFNGKNFVIGLNSYSSTACSRVGNVDKFARLYPNRYEIAQILYFNDFSGWRKLP